MEEKFFDYELNKTYKKKRFQWTITPFISIGVILLVMIGYIALQGSSIDFTRSGVFIYLNLLLLLLGLVSIIGIIVGFILSIVYMVKVEQDPNLKYDPNSGKGNDSQIPEEIKGWSWGAAGLTWIWGGYHKVWISFLHFIPYVNLIWWIILGFKGNAWAWQSMKWESIEHFKQEQQRWKPWGIATILIVIVLFILGVISAILTDSRYPLNYY